MTETDHKASEELLRKVLLGNELVLVETPTESVWDFRFSGVHLNVGAPWRILDDQSVRLGSCDHAHKFGLPQAVNAVSLAMEWLGGKRVKNVSLAPNTADLQLAFEGGFSLQIINHSSGWEGWNVSCDSGMQVVALGGGDVSIFVTKS
jgi:hypothetical protein